MLDSRSMHRKVKQRTEVDDPDTNDDDVLEELEADEGTLCGSIAKVSDQISTS